MSHTSSLFVFSFSPLDDGQNMLSSSGNFWLLDVFIIKMIFFSEYGMVNTSNTAKMPNIILFNRQ